MTNLDISEKKYWKQPHKIKTKLQTIKNVMDGFDEN